MSTGFAVVMGASGCSKNVDAAAAAETVAAVDVPASYDTPAEKNASRADREEPKRTERHADIASEQVESRLAPTDAWMFRGSVDESAAPVSTQGSITPQPQPQPKPTIQPQPPKPPSTAPVVVNQPQRPPGWQIRAACGRG
ncbi:MAG: hypothetical protein U0414_36180 [Polyangiaceae bacterium]